MAWRERLIRLGDTAVAVSNERRVRVAAQLLLFVGIVFVLLRVRSIWRSSHVHAHSISWLSLTAAGVLAAAALLAAGCIWLSILRGLGLAPRMRWMGVFFQAQLGKYIPGSVWHYAGRVALARGHAISGRAVALSLPVELAGSVAGAGAFSALVVGWWGALAVVLVLAAIRIALRLWDMPEPGGQRALRLAVCVTPLYMAAFPLNGIGFWLVARALVGAPLRDLPVYMGAFAAAWVVGVVAVYAPGGIGVREAMLVAILAGRIGSADALIVAAVSRGILAVVDVVFAVVGNLVLGRITDPSSA